MVSTHNEPSATRGGTVPALQVFTVKFRDSALGPLAVQWGEVLWAGMRGAKMEKGGDQLPCSIFG